MDPATFMSARAKLAYYESLRTAAPVRNQHRRLPILGKLFSLLLVKGRPAGRGHLQREASILASMGKLHG